MEPQTTTPAQNNWPGAFGVYKQSRRAILLNIAPLLGVFGLNLLFSIFLDVLVPDNDAATVMAFVVQIFSLIVSAVTTIAVTDLELAGVDGQKLTLKESFRKVGALWLNMVALLILTGITLFLSFLALIIPFFFVFPRVVLAPYFMVDKQLNAIEALKASWNQTKGNSAKVWGIIGATIVMALPIFTIIGIPIAIYLLLMYAAAYAILYRHITGGATITTSTELPQTTAANTIAPAPTQTTPPVAEVSPQDQDTQQ